MPAALPRALVFDVFGTLVDWHTCIAQEVAQALGPQVNGRAFADAWRDQYQPAMDEVRSGQRPFGTLDSLHRRNLDVVLADMGLAERVDEATRQHLTLAWHRLDAWPEVPAALQRLRSRFLLAPCSNGHIALMVALARRNGLHWDAICGAELARDYKPTPVVYQTAAAALGLAPDEVLMVACHSWDLAAAARAGLRTAFIARPAEHGPGRGETSPAVPVDWVGQDLADLADQLLAAAG
jgi:2-haloacid dehalogenase